MRDELVDFLKRFGVEQKIDPLAGRQLTGRLLAAKALFAASQLRTALEILEVVGIHSIAKIAEIARIAKNCILAIFEVLAILAIA
jgi:hypothetical protein